MYSARLVLFSTKLFSTKLILADVSTVIGKDLHVFSADAIQLRKYRNEFQRQQGSRSLSVNPLGPSVFLAESL